eukprot:40471_1
MDPWPIPAKWKRYQVDRYLCHPTKLRILHGILMLTAVISFAWFMVYFMTLDSYEQTYIGIENLSNTYSAWTCWSIGTRSNDQYNFASITDNTSLLNNSRFSIQFLNFDIYSRYSTFGPHYSYWRETVLLNNSGYSNINWKPSENSPLFKGGLADYDATMNYSIDKGNINTLDECPMLSDTICEQTQSIPYFFYNIYVMLNLSYYADQIIANYHKWKSLNISDSQQLSLYYRNYNTETDERISKLSDYPALNDNWNWTQFLTYYDESSQYWWLTRTNGGIIKSVWDLCKDKFVDIGNRSLFISVPYGVSHTVYELNVSLNSFRVNISLDDHPGIVQCLYNDAKHGLVVTDIQDTFGQNHIIPTPMKEAGILLKLPNDAMNYSNTLTTIAQGHAIDIRINDKHNTILNTSDAIDIWKHEICREMVFEYCQYVEVPPYYCTKTENKTWQEGVSLSLSPCSLIYTTLIMCLAYIAKCWDCINRRKSHGINEEEKGISLLTVNHESDHLERIQRLEQMVQQMTTELVEVKSQLASAKKQ